MGGNKNTKANTKAAAGTDDQQPKISSFFAPHSASAAMKQPAGGTPDTQLKKRAQPDGIQQSASAPDKQPRPNPVGTNVEQQQIDVANALTKRKDELFTGTDDSLRFKDSGPDASWDELLDAVRNCSLERLGNLHAALCKAK